MLCQVCGAPNPPEREYCERCHHKLLVVSGAVFEEEEESYEEELEEAISFDEHLLERISALEEAVRRIGETAGRLLAAVEKQERTILLNQSGVGALRELLEEKGHLGGGEWSERWEERVARQFRALEKRERFRGVRERISALYRGSRRELFTELLAEAERSLMGYDAEGAVEALEEAHELDPANEELAAFLGESWFDEGDLERARVYFDRVLAAAPEHYEGRVYAGVLAHERGEEETAREHLERALEVRDGFLPRFGLGAVYAGRGEPEAALVHLERAVEIAPVPQAYHLLGRCWHELGRKGLATDALERAVELAPDHEEAHHLLGLVYLDRGWRKKALEAFRRALSLNPKKLRYQDLVRYLAEGAPGPLPAVGEEAAAWLDRGARSLERGHVQQAWEAHRRALASEEDNPTLLMSYALVCLQAGRAREIEAVARRVVELDPGEMLTATAYAAWIEALRSEGRCHEGNRVGRRLLDVARSSYGRTIAYYEIACNLAELEEDLDEALDCARRAVDLSPEELRAFPLDALGWVHYKRRELGEAVACLSRASELAPSPTTLTHLGLALLADGDEEAARGALTRAGRLSSQGEALGERMMEVMQESARLSERVRAGRRPPRKGRTGEDRETASPAGQEPGPEPASSA